MKASLKSFTIGGDQIIADLLLCLDRGVLVARHSMPWAFAGFNAKEVGTGLEITAAFPDCFAEKVGLHEGHLLLPLHGALVFTRQGPQGMLRVLEQGREVEATWVRRRELQPGITPL